MSRTSAKTLPLGTDHMFAIAAVITTWSALEWMLHVAFATFLDLRPLTGKRLAARIRNVNILLIEMRKLSGMNKAELRTFDRLKASILKLQAERDEIAHRMWFRIEGSDDAAHGLMLTRVEEHPPTRRESVAIAEIADRIIAVATEFTIFTAAVAERRDASPSRSSASAQSRRRSGGARKARRARP